MTAVHHWNFGKTLFPEQIVDPRNLVPAPSRKDHEEFTDLPVELVIFWLDLYRNSILLKYLNGILH
jgi:hypothetical protein